MAISLVELLGHSFSFLAPAYVQVGSVCKEWKGAAVSVWPSTATSFTCCAAEPELLAWARQHCGFPYCESTCAALASQGDLHGLRNVRSTSPPCPWHVGTLVAAAYKGHLHILQWVHEQGELTFSGEVVCRAAAQRGDLIMLRWLREEMSPPCAWDWTCALAAARSGDLPTLQYTMDQQTWFNEIAVQEAAVEAGHLHIVLWLCYEGPRPWCNPQYIIDIAIYFKHRHILQFIRDCPESNASTRVQAERALSALI